MSCFEEFTYAMYADGELAPDETSKVEDHLETCLRCGEVVDALRTENRLFAEALSPVPARRIAPAPWRVARISAAAILLAAVMQAGWSVLRGIEVPGALSWLNPFSVLLDGIVLVVTEGGDMLLASMVHVTGVLFAAVLVAGLLRFRRRALATASLAMILLLPGIASAQDQGTVVIPAGETINGTTVKGGKMVALDGDVDGDLFIFSERAIVRGTVRGNLFAFAKSVEIEGTVEGAVYAAGQDVTVAGTVTGNVYAAGKAARVEEGASIGKDLFCVGETCTVAGKVGRDAHAYGANVEIRGAIHRNLATGGDSVTLLPPASVGGDLTVEVPADEHFRLAEGVTVVGETTLKKPQPSARCCPNKYATGKFYLMQVVWMVGALMVGVLAMLLVPGFYSHRLASAGNGVLTMVVGLVALFMIPITALILCVTVFGLPLGLISFALWGIGLYIAKIVVAAQIGQGILGSANGSNWRLVVRLLLGLIIIYVGINLPVVGGAIGFVVLLIGLGSLVMPMFRRKTPEMEII